MSDKKAVGKYAEEYKREALTLAEEIGMSEASAKLGIATKTLYGWRSAQHAVQKPISKEPESEQIKRLYYSASAIPNLAKAGNKH